MEEKKKVDTCSSPHLMEEESEKKKNLNPSENGGGRDGLSSLKHINLEQGKREERTKIGTAASGVGRSATADPGKGKRLDGKRLIVDKLK